MATTDFKDYWVLTEEQFQDYSNLEHTEPDCVLGDFLGGFQRAQIEGEWFYVREVTMFDIFTDEDEFIYELTVRSLNLSTQTWGGV